MPQDVVVLMQAELSDADAAHVTALHANSEDVVSYHLLVSECPPGNGAAALIGVDPAETFGSTAVARQAGVEHDGEFDSRPETLLVVERSARRLRAAAAEEIDFTVTDADIWSSARALVRSTNSREIILVADADSYPQVFLPDWQLRARAYLAVDDLHAIKHTT